MRLKMLLVGLTALGAVATASADVALIEDDFSSSGITDDSRFSANYAGGSAEIPLFNTPNLTATSTVANVTNFADGVTAYITQSTNTHTVVLTIIASGYGGWASDYGVGATTGNDDGDAHNNLYEYGLGGDPTNSAVLGMDSSMESGSGYIDYVHVRRVAATNEISYALALTADLVNGSWTTNTGYTVEGYGPVVDDFDTVTNRIDTTGKTDGRVHRSGDRRAVGSKLIEYCTCPCCRTVRACCFVLDCNPVVLFRDKAGFQPALGKRSHHGKFVPDGAFPSPV